MPVSAFESAGCAPAPPVEWLAGIANVFAPIALPELDGARLMDRVDTKYVFPCSEAPALLDRLADEYRALEVNGERVIAYLTLYFDTLSRSCYLDHHNGRSNRRKFRMRQYGPTGKAFFEVKLKNNRGRTVKQREPIAAIGEELDPIARRLVRSVTGAEPDLVPAIVTRFVRLTLVGRDRPERVTIDTALSFHGSTGRHARLPGAAIVEVKVNRPGDRSPLRTRLRESGRQPTRISKYCIGSLLLDPTLKHNRFKRALRVVQNLA